MGPTDISWQEAVNGHLATAWKSKSVQDKLPDFLMNGAQFDGSPDQPKFRTGDGETVRQMNGQVYNPMTMLADAIGVSTSNQKRCACYCCRTKMRTPSVPGADVCTRVLVGSLWDISEAECKSEVCEEAYPGECPSPSQVAQRTGLISAKFVRRQADPSQVQ